MLSHRKRVHVVQNEQLEGKLMNPLKAHYLLGEGGYQGDINGPIPF